MIAESRTEEKDVMAKVVVNLINKNNSSFPQLFYPLMTRQFFCDFHEKSEDFCVS